MVLAHQTRQMDTFSLTFTIVNCRFLYRSPLHPSKGNRIDHNVPINIRGQSMIACAVLATILPTQVQSMFVKRRQHNARAGQRLQCRPVYSVSVESVKMNHDAHDSSSMHAGICTPSCRKLHCKNSAEHCFGRLLAFCRMHAYT